MTTRNDGYTLIEVIIALALFALVTTLSATVIKQAFDTRAQLMATTDRLHAVELVVSLLQRDSAHITNRAIRSTDKQLFPPFIGESNYLEFTRNGIVNPNAMQKRSTMKRVALLCEQKRLIRRTWLSLDAPSHHKFMDKILLDNLEHCTFSYLSQTQEQLSEWRPYALGKKQSKTVLPSAILLRIKPEKLGQATLFFIIPEGLYGA